MSQWKCQSQWNDQWPLLWVHRKNESPAHRTIRRTSSAVLIGCDFTIWHGQPRVYISEDEAREIHVCFMHVHHHFNRVLRWRTRKTRRRGERGKEEGRVYNMVCVKDLNCGFLIKMGVIWDAGCGGSVSWTWGEEGGFVKRAGEQRI